MRKKTRVLSLNVNDFGGKTDHLMEHQYHNRRYNRDCIDWIYWANNVPKTETWNKLKEYINSKEPDILIFEEMLVSCNEKEIDFFGELKDMGYPCLEGCIPRKGNFSLTALFFKSGNPTPTYISFPWDHRANRGVICEYDEILICGTHFPSEADKLFLENMGKFLEPNLKKDLLLIGDLNANDPKKGNKMFVNNLLKKGAEDLWIAANNAEDTPTEAQYQGRLDYAIASPSLAKKVERIEIDPYVMDKGVTDHAAIIVDIVK